MMAILMSAKASANKQGMNFSGDEMNLIVEILKQQMSDDERKKADMIISMFQKMSKQN